MARQQVDRVVRQVVSTFRSFMGLLVGSAQWRAQIATIESRPRLAAINPCWTSFNVVGHFDQSSWVIEGWKMLE